MAAARTLGLVAAAARARAAAAAVMAPRAAPFAPQLGRRCPLSMPLDAPHARRFLGPRPPPPVPTRLDPPMPRAGSLLHLSSRNANGGVAGGTNQGAGAAERQGTGTHATADEPQRTGPDEESAPQNAVESKRTGPDEERATTQDAAAESAPQDAAEMIAPQDAAEVRGTSDDEDSPYATTPTAANSNGGYSSGNGDDFETFTNDELFAVVRAIRTMIRKMIINERQRADEETRDRVRRASIFILVGVLVEAIVVAAVAMCLGVWLGLKKAKEAIEFLKNTPEGLEMIRSGVEFAMGMIYNGSVGMLSSWWTSKTNVFWSLIFKTPTTEEEKLVTTDDSVAEQGKSAGTVKEEEKPGEVSEENKPGEVTKEERPGEGAMLMLFVLVLFYFN